jgi:hypothetical protein
MKFASIHDKLYFEWIIALIISLLIQEIFGNMGIVCAIFFLIAFIHDFFHNNISHSPLKETSHIKKKEVKS